MIDAPRVPLLDGVIQNLSVSQAESFDPSRPAGCQRRWYFERVEGRRPDKDTAQSDGDIGHDLLAGYLLTGKPPAGRVKMGKAVRGAIAKGLLPVPGTGPALLVESRFDRQPKIDASGNRVPLDRDATFWLGGIPWDGYVDLRWQDADGVINVLDHKFSSDIHQYAKPADQLINTVQMPVYVLDSRRLWPDAKRFRMIHHYVSRSGVDSFIRTQDVGEEQIFAREDQVRRLVSEIRDVALMKSQEEVPFNRRACGAYSGCPHQSICTAFKFQKVSMTREEEDVFKSIEIPTDPLADIGDVFGKPLAGVDAGHGAGDQAGGTDFPEPEASKPEAQPPPDVCECGTTLGPDNTSVLQSGARVHVKCPITAPAKPPREKKPKPPKPDAAPLLPLNTPTTQRIQSTEPNPPSNMSSPPSEDEIRRMQDDAARVVLESVAGHEELARRHLEQVARTDARPGTNTFQVNGGLDVRVVVMLDVSPGLTALIERLLSKGGR